MANVNFLYDDFVYMGVATIEGWECAHPHQRPRLL